MATPFRLLLLLLLSALLGACGMTSAKSNISPSNIDMRKALKTLLIERPDISIPEFQEALELDPAVARGGTVFIGPWNLYPDLLSFEAVFTAPNISFYEIAGRFEQDPSGHWRAILRRVKKTQPNEIGEYWRASEVNPY
ncbi:MAG TPA: hypothetical protein VGN88_11815 [Phycisphaerae bacterium]|jgi:hypothetical protein